MYQATVHNPWGKISKHNKNAGRGARGASSAFSKRTGEAPHVRAEQAALAPCVAALALVVVPVLEPRQEAAVPGSLLIRFVIHSVRY